MPEDLRKYGFLHQYKSSIDLNVKVGFIFLEVEMNVQYKMFSKKEVLR